MRYFIQLAFDGTDFHGWQMQDNAPSIQEELTRSIGTILQLNIELVGCGRTDAGVHASQFYAHFELDESLPMTHELFIFKLNGLLHRNIAVSSLLAVTETAHARFDARSRTYQYRITKVKDPFQPNGAYHFYHELDLDRMNKACQLLLGEQDFGCFCKSHTDNHTKICTVTHAEWTQDLNMIEFTITANRFLRNMVRAIVGTLIDIGTGKTSVDELSLIIESKDRTRAGRSVPAQGLYLTDVQYPPSIFLENK